MSQVATPEREDSHYPRIVRAVFETPWAIVPETLAAILDLIALRASGERLDEEEIQARIGAGQARRDVAVSGSVAVIPVYGVIVPRADLFSSMSGGTSVQRLSSAFADALGDEEIKSIVLDVDSPGGQTDMIPELAAEIRAARGQKPIVAVADTHASSAAYWLASQADEVVASPSAQVGSIGVFAAHKEISAMEEKLGVKTTLVSAGKYKTEISPFEPLSEEAQTAIQARVDDHYAMFVSDVAAGRRVPVEAVKSGYGEGRVLPARKALAEGMVDRIDTLQSVVSRLQNPSGRTRVSSAQARTAAEAVRKGYDDALSAGPIAPHSTATSDASWDGPTNKANLRNDGGEGYLRSAFAWQDSSAAATNKGSYKFIHHEVAENGDVGAANLTACSTGIAVLNGGRTGTTIPSGDRRGVYNHLAKHLRDGGKEPPPLASPDDPEAAESGLSFADAVDEAHRAFDSVVDGAEALRVLSRRKRDQIAALIERAGELLATTQTTESDDDGARAVAAYVARLASQRGAPTR